VRIVAIDHVQVVGPPGSEPDARAFYGELLGLEELPRPKSLPDPNGIWFRAGAQQLHVVVEEPFHAAQKAHPGFLVDDLDGLLVKLQAAGTQARMDHSIPGLARDSIPSLARAFIYDPFGNRVELRQADPWLHADGPD
jgi:hypothetical protein